jgi:hypothetical protein
MCRGQQYVVPGVFEASKAYLVSMPIRVHSRLWGSDLPSSFVAHNEFACRPSLLACNPTVFSLMLDVQSMSDVGVRLTAGFAGYVQYEVSIPMEIAADCMAEVSWKACLEANLAACLESALPIQHRGCLGPGRAWRSVGRRFALHVLRLDVTC